MQNTKCTRLFTYIAYIACGSASLCIKTLYFFICTFFMLAAATVANIKIRYDAKAPQFAIFGTRVICVLYSISFKGYVTPLIASPVTWCRYIGKIATLYRIVFSCLAFPRNVLQQISTFSLLSFIRKTNYVRTLVISVISRYLDSGINNTIINKWFTELTVNSISFRSIFP